MSALPAAMFMTAGLAQLGAGIGGYVQSRSEAKMLRKMGKDEAELERMRGRKLAGKQRAAYGKAGVRIGVGTPLEVLAETAWTTELNALREQFRWKSAAHRRRQQGGAALMQSILGALGSGARGIQAMPGRGPKLTPVTSTTQSGMFDWLEASGGSHIA